MGSVDVSIVLPIYNETARLVSGLAAIVEYLEEKTPSRFGRSKLFTTWEIVMVDDGSHIPASEVINHSYLREKIVSLIEQKKFVGIRYAPNQGKGKAIAQGVIKARGKVILFSDIDGSVQMDALPEFLKALKTHDVAVGSRRLPESVIAVHQGIFRETGGRVYTFLSKTFFNLGIHDVTCGFKAFRSAVAKQLFSQSKISRWSFDTEILALAINQGYSLQEIPVVWANKQGSKVKFEETFESFIDLFRIYWNMKKNKEELEVREGLEVLGGGCDSCGRKQFTFLFDHHNNWKVQKCSVCGLVQVMPRPSRKEVSALYHDDEGHFDPYIEQESVHRRYFQKKLEQIHPNPLPDGEGKSPFRLLDVGCLTGVLIDEAERMGMTATGVDISKDAVTYCKKRGLTAVHGTLDSFIKKFPRKKFDAVTALEIIEHEYSPRNLVETMYKALQPNGIAMVSTPNHGSWWRQLMGKKWPGYTHPEHLYFFDEQSLERLFQSVGFREISVVSGDSRPFPLWFLFKRGADYFPEFAPVLKLLTAITKPLPLNNPINPWDDLLVIAKK